MQARRRAGKPSSADTEERRLVEAAQRDLGKFGELYDIHFERVYAFVVRRVRDRNAAEDLTSEVFHKALANLRNYEWRGAPFAAWLMRIAANVVSDEWKRSAATAKLLVEETSSAHERSELDVQAELQMVETRACLFRLVNELPDDQRMVILERFVEQRSIHDIAQRLGRSDGAVKQLQFRALQRLREQMEGANA